MTEEKNFFTSFDGCRLFFRAWEKEVPNRLFIIHGFGEHSGRYQELVNAVSDLPLSIYSYDLRGHGRSDGDRVYVDHFETLIRDTLCFRDMVDRRSLQANPSYLLLGQSLGGLIAASIVLQDQKNWKSLFLLSPFFGLPFAEQFLTGLCSILDLIVPMKVWDNPIPPIYLTHDSEQILLYQADSLIQRRITIRFAKEMLRACQAIRGRAREFSIPVGILASGNDRIVSVNKTKVFFDGIGSSNKRLEIFDGFYHELLHETDRLKPIHILKEYLIHMGL